MPRTSIFSFGRFSSILILNFFEIFVFVTSMTELRTSLISIFSNSPFANSTSSLEEEEISEINLSSLFNSLKAIYVISFLSASSLEICSVSIALCNDVNGFLSS